MTQKKNTEESPKKNRPVNIYTPTFHGIVLSDEQKKFVDEIYDTDNLIVFVDAAAGTGKTTLAVGAACTMCGYFMYDGIIYVSACTQQDEIGFLPGDYSEKISAYISPLYQALSEIREDRIKPVIDTKAPACRGKNGESYIIAMTPNFMRGQNIKNAVVIIDEAQNMTIPDLRTILTRCDDNCKVVCIGSSLQIDLPRKSDSGFKDCIEHFSEKEWASVCELKENHRGKLSAWADKLV